MVIQNGVVVPRQLLAHLLIFQLNKHTIPNICEIICVKKRIAFLIGCLFVQTSQIERMNDRRHKYFVVVKKIYPRKRTAIVTCRQALTGISHDTGIESLFIAIIMILFILTRINQMSRTMC